MSNSLRLCSFDESDLLRFGTLRGVRQQERSLDPLQRPAKRYRVIEIALGRGDTRLAGEPVVGVAWAQHHGELCASSNQRVGKQRADHSCSAADEHTRRHWHTSADEDVWGVLR